MKTAIKQVGMIVCLTLILFIALISEPMVKINGWAELKNDKLSSANTAIKIFDRDSVDITDDIDVKLNQSCKINKVNNDTLQAFVCTEDLRFYEHEGVDYYRIIGALVKNLSHGANKQGGSTITQQLIKNTHLSSEKKIKRKLQELRLARLVERKFTKNEIMEMYLNILYFGNDIYGIAQASNIYFHHSYEKLTVAESAGLAAIINNPRLYDPLSNRENFEKRKNLVLFNMYKNKRLSKEQYQKATNEQLKIYPISQTSAISSMIINDACSKLGITRCELLAGNYKIYTYLDMQLQREINDLISNMYLPEKGNINIVCQVLDNDECKIVAQSAISDTNVNKLRRQPGSTIKPIVAYAPSLEMNVITPKSMLIDEPHSFDGYTPRNYSNVYYGQINATDALAYSQNIPAVALVEKCGIKKCKKIASKLGIPFTEHDNGYAIALGGLYEGLNICEITSAYAAIANDGYYTRGEMISRITLNDKTVYFNRKTRNMAISSKTARNLDNMLHACCEYGTARRLRSIENVRAKTGTVGNSNGNTDALIVAYNDNYTVCVWLSARRGLMNQNITGGGYPAVIAKNILSMSNIDSIF